MLEELLAWLTDAQALLATKEHDPIPDDIKVVETLLKEHLVSPFFFSLFFLPTVISSVVPYLLD